MVATVGLPLEAGVGVWGVDGAVVVTGVVLVRVVVDVEVVVGVVMVVMVVVEAHADRGPT